MIFYKICIQYDTDDDYGIEIVLFESYEQPNIEDVVDESNDLNLEVNELEWLLRDLILWISWASQGIQIIMKIIPRFHGLNNSPISHVTSFIDVVSKLNVVHENVKMKMFITSLDFLEDEIFY